jgi:hypothetical protein
MLLYDDAIICQVSHYLIFLQIVVLLSVVGLEVLASLTDDASPQKLFFFISTNITKLFLCVIGNQCDQIVHKIVSCATF